MLSFFRRKRAEIITAVPLTNIQCINESGIHYLDNEGNPAMIRYSDAWKGWLKNKDTGTPKPKYICDRTKSEGWKLIFYTHSIIEFYSNPSEEDLWIEICSRITVTVKTNIPPE